MQLLAKDQILVALNYTYVVTKCIYIYMVCYASYIYVKSILLY